MFEQSIVEMKKPYACYTFSCSGKLLRNEKKKIKTVKMKNGLMIFKILK